MPRVAIGDAVLLVWVKKKMKKYIHTYLYIYIYICIRMYICMYSLGGCFVVQSTRFLPHKYYGFSLTNGDG